MLLTQPPENTTTTEYAASLVVSARPACLYGLTVYNSKGSTQFIQVHDAASLPADAAVPVLVFAMATGTHLRVDFGKYGRFFSTGIVVCNSSTGPTKTIGSADVWVDAQHS